MIDQMRQVAQTNKRERLQWLQKPNDTTTTRSNTGNTTSDRYHQRRGSNIIQNNSPHRGTSDMHTKRRKLQFDTMDKKAKKPYKAPPTILDGKEVPKLNSSDPEEANRINRRKRVVGYGKNTIGYDEYIKQIPKHKRKPRTLEHPMTPDAEADIPNRRWLGMVKAWRKSLHKYDPPHMANNPDMPTHKPVSLCNELLLPKKPTKVLTAQEQQIHEAQMQQLPVDFSNVVAVSQDDKTNDVVMATHSISDDTTAISEESEQQIDVCMNNESFVNCRWGDACDSDSDDDLL